MLKVIGLIALLMIGTLVGLVMFPPPSSQFQDSPLASKTLTPEPQAQIDGIANASSLLWLPNQQRWLVGTLAPQTVLVNGSAQLAYLNQQLTSAELEPLPASGDIADLALLDEHLIGISGDGRLLYFEAHQQRWKFVDKRKWLRGGLHHKTAGLVWDPKAGLFYTCEREGLKRCYRADRDGQQQDEFDLQITEQQQASLAQYQIGSMTWHQGQWYALSSRYSSLLQIEPESGQVLNVIALAQEDTAQAIASDGDKLWLLSVIRQQPETIKLATIPLP
ncbi:MULTISPECIES: hypothetical protein [unclassified Agarivorans]|uniref:hypothetical protein n=1 Tax=unclassified Agarivorans TaxID=2636026 RepID=UPI0026E1ED90|nr:MULTISPECIES: hypothetical protein [unclassified Agarivorans]MDO6685605.1 hypothetical protein [Agarivorans sp. 3_MG-2023]MDO6715991.1 hypothetical protein [Agarivorans sp. 2_MG-2023]